MPRIEVVVLVLLVVVVCDGAHNCGDDEARGCVGCSEDEVVEIEVCADKGMRKVVCDTKGVQTYKKCEVASPVPGEGDGEYTSRQQEVIVVKPQSVRTVLRNSLYSFELVCLVLALSCGLFMQHRKALLIAQQQHRYFKLIERS